MDRMAIIPLEEYDKLKKEVELKNAPIDKIRESITRLLDEEDKLGHKNFIFRVLENAILTYSDGGNKCSK